VGQLNRSVKIVRKVMKDAMTVETLAKKEGVTKIVGVNRDNKIVESNLLEESLASAHLVENFRKQVT